jgi:uncharacterized repeat protein (TIGR03806 family)
LKRAAKCAALLLAFAWLSACSSGEDTQQNDPPTNPPPPPPPPPPTTEPTGLDSRPSNTTCLAWDRPSADDTIALTRYTNLSFNQPVAMLQAPPPAGNSRWFVVEKPGVVRTFPTANPTASTVFIDISGAVDDGGEQGLLGMAFHPDFPTDPRVFLSYSSTASGRVSRISAFRTLDNGATLDPGTEQILLTVDQPANESNHKGGNIAFAPGNDRELYIGLGDGGGGGDNHGSIGNGQRMTTMLGKMLRIDVGTDPMGTTYAVPASNPFFNASTPGDKCPAAGRGSGTCPEIYASGFRNPWRWSFDRLNGSLWVGDVGQGSWEEVDLVTVGNNYGWRCREGAHDFNTSGCPGGGLTDPIVEYGRTQGASITGGYVYRGTQTTNLVGRYIFGDFVSGRIWAWIPESAPSPREPTELLDTSLSISSFGQANDGELYVVNFNGTLHHIEFDTGPVTGSVPQNLSQTGCVSTTDAKQPASGMIPYAINAPFWSDGASKERWLALPNGQSATVRTDGDWDFPIRTVLMKNFSVGTRLIETRLLMRHPDGTWGGFSYEWNAGQTDAALVDGRVVRDIGNGQNWIFPSGDDCLACHTDAANRALGLETAQLNRTLTYPQTGRTANELITLSHVGLLSPPITVSATQASMPDPADPTASLTNRARAYLHTNCAQCHRPSGPTPSSMDLRYTTALNMTNACNVSPSSGDLGIGVNARLIAPGNVANSIIVNRANRRDGNQMPPLGSNRVDTDGVALLTQWINGLTGC